MWSKRTWGDSAGWLLCHQFFFTCWTLGFAVDPPCLMLVVFVFVWGWAKDSHRPNEGRWSSNIGDGESVSSCTWAAPCFVQYKQFDAHGDFIWINFGCLTSGRWGWSPEMLPRWLVPILIDRGFWCWWIFHPCSHVKQVKVCLGHFWKLHSAPHLCSASHFADRKWVGIRSSIYMRN